MIKASFLILIILTILIDLWALSDLFKEKDKGSFWWIIIILALPALGAIAYFQLRFRRNRNKSS